MPLSWIAILKVSSFALIEISTLLFSGEYFIALLIKISAEFFDNQQRLQNQPAYLYSKQYSFFVPEA